MDVSIKKSLVVTLVAVLAGTGISCGKSHDKRQGAGATRAQTGAASNEQLRDIDDLVGENFRMGPELPQDWPMHLVPTPAGASVVASLSKTSIPGSPGPATAALYSAPQSAAEIQAFFAEELPKRGWEVLESSPPGDPMVTAARGNGYLGIFSSGTELGPAGAGGTGTITMQVILGEMAE